MSVSVNEFWNRIATSGIADADECRAMAVSFAQAHEGSPPADARSLARHLVQTERLSPYQAKALLASDEPTSERATLRIGKFLITQPMSQPPFQGWFWARSRASEGPASLLYPLGPHADADRRWLFSHQAVEGSHLQPIELAGGETAASAAGDEIVISRLPAGVSLAELLKKKGGLDQATVRQIGIAVAQALQALHEGGISHGAVRPERIWIGNERSVWLLRDATGPAMTPFENRPGWFRPLEVPALYAAPEFSLPGQVADPLTDQYALGCLLWHARTGTPPHPASTTDALIRQHTVETPEPLRRAVEAGAAGDPLLRVIAHAMSKNAEARFRETAGLLAALESIDGDVTSPANPEKRALETAGPGRSPAPKPGADELVPDTRPSRKQPPPGKARKELVSRRRKKNKKAPLMIGGLGFVVMVLMVLVLVTRSGNGPADDGKPGRPPVAYQPSPPGAAGERSAEPATPATDDSDAYQLVNDPKTLWLPPSSGEPPSLGMIPPGPQMVVHLRLRRILASPAGQQMLSAIDRELGDAWNRLEARTGVPAEQIERLTLALEGGGDGHPTVALGVELSAPVPLGKLQAQWKAESARTPQGATVFAGEERGADAYFVAADAFEEETPVDAFAVGTLDQIKLVAELEGGPIPLPRSLERLWRSANEDADLVVLGNPNFLFADGRQMLARYASEAVDPLKRFLLPDVAGMMLTSTLQPQWYVEVRLAPGSGASAAMLVQQLKTSVQRLPQWAEQFLIDSSPDASWKSLALRLPQMMFAVSDYARFGISEDQAVGNLYLPEIAAPNVSLATLLAVNTPAGAANRAGTDVGSEPALTLDQMLERPMSIQFDQEPLQVAANAIIDEFASGLPDSSSSSFKTPEIFVIGGDLETEGITQNQQIRDFELTDKKLRTVLTELVMRGNPVTTVESPTEEEQQLVWVVGPHPDAPDQQAILVTTRAVAADKYSLPREFVAD